MQAGCSTGRRVSRTASPATPSCHLPYLETVAFDLLFGAVVAGLRDPHSALPTAPCLCDGPPNDAEQRVRVRVQRTDIRQLATVRNAADKGRGTTDSDGTGTKGRELLLGISEHCVEGGFVESAEHRGKVVCGRHKSSIIIVLLAPVHFVRKGVVLEEVVLRAGDFSRNPVGRDGCAAFSESE